MTSASTSAPCQSDASGTTSTTASHVAAAVAIGVVDQASATELGELLGAAEALTPTGGDDHRPDARNRHRARYFLAAAFLAGAFFAGAAGLSSLLSTSSRRASAASSSTLSANVSSDTRI